MMTEPRALSRRQLHEWADVPKEMADILIGVSKRTGLSIRELRGDSRMRHLVDARRRVALAAFRRGFSTPVIGRALNRDHTTIVHHLKGAIRPLVPGDVIPRKVSANEPRVACDLAEVKA